MTTANASPSATQIAPWPGRAIRYALLASLAVNLLVIGAIIGGNLYYRSQNPMGRQARGKDDFGLMALSRSFSPERRTAIRKDLSKAREARLPLIEALQQAEKESAAVLGAQTFNKDALRAAMIGTSEREMKARADAIEAFLSQAEKLEPEERQELSTWWIKNAARHQKPKRPIAAKD